MSGGAPHNLAASVLDRLRARARANSEDLQTLLTRYALERLLYRLSVSDERDRFLLKGAMLFAAWTDQPQRPTRDLDLLGYGDATPKALAEVVRAICATEVAADGLVFATETIVATAMKEGEDYPGVRLALDARLGSARIRVLIDVGFGDVVTPAPEELSYPTLLDFPAPRLRAYPRETVVAEKLEATVRLGLANSRMKDFFDLWALSREFAFDGATLTRAVAATFSRRGTAIPTEAPVALTPAFAADASKAAQWRAFLDRSRLTGDVPTLLQTVEALRAFLSPVFAAAGVPPRATWPPGGPWQSDTLRARQSPGTPIEPEKENC